MFQIKLIRFSFTCSLTLCWSFQVHQFARKNVPDKCSLNEFCCFSQLFKKGLNLGTRDGLASSKFSCYFKKQKLIFNEYYMNILWCLSVSILGKYNISLKSIDLKCYQFMKQNNLSNTVRAEFDRQIYSQYKFVGRKHNGYFVVVVKNIVKFGAKTAGSSVGSSF